MNRQRRSIANLVLHGTPAHWDSASSKPVLRWTGLACGVLASFLVSLPPSFAASGTLVVDTPMSPPTWALLERQLLRSSSEACSQLADWALDERGYLLHRPRWGVIDGPDDAIETFHNWPLLHALGGSDSVLEDYSRAQEGHWLQYAELRTEKTDLAREGAYFQEFITMSDWAHTLEGMQSFISQGLSTPEDSLYRKRMKRFAGFYMAEDPDVPNYDPVHKVIRSVWTGSKGPMMRKPTVYDWVGDPISGRFHFLHSSAGRGRMLDFDEHYPKMLAHCENYTDSVGDSHLNLYATNLAVNAYALTGERKYRDWLLEYVDAWKERIASNGGNIPTKVGLDGKLGGESGQWWKGLYGWNFSNFDAEVGFIKHRGNFYLGPWDGFGNAFLLTGDPAYIGVLRRQLDNLYSLKKVVAGKTQIPWNYGDPRGYKYSDRAEWYNWTDKLPHHLLTEIYMWSMDRKDLKRIPKTGWLGFLEGNDSGYPERALRADLESVRKAAREIEEDPTTPDTRLPDWFMALNPARTETLNNLMLGGYYSTGVVRTLHSRLRYFDPARRRSGPPEEVAALVDSLSINSVSVTLVNLNPVYPREIVVQAGGYAEHQFTSVERKGQRSQIDGSSVTIRLEPGSGDRLTFQMRRYANQPTLLSPWSR